MDYEKLGFKAGIEIHQQLEGKKLFCDDFTEIRKEKPDFKITRVLRASAGESGGVDKAAAYEQQKSKVFEYLGYKDINCLVETDDEPPHDVNLDALNSAFIMAKLLNMKVPDKIQFMRKVVIDGSNTSGFQRTALIGVDGFIEVNGKKFGVESLCLEEEACQVIKRGKEKDTYNLSRLGIPLLEIATAPDMKTAEECKEVAGAIGKLIRSLSNAKRGIGSIRQDVNVSIKGGVRVEIKGFQDYKNIPKVIDFEINRQLSLIKKKEKLISHVRKAEPDFSTSYLRPMPGADRMYPETDVEVIVPNLKNIDIPETISEAEKRYKEEFELNDDQSKNAVKHDFKNDFELEKLFKKYSSKNLKPAQIFEVYLYKIPEFMKKENVNDVDFDEILKNLSKGKVTIQSLQNIVKDYKSGKVDFTKYEVLSDKKLEDIISKIVSKNKDAPRGALMGMIMKKIQGKAEGSKVKQILNKKL